MNALVPPAKTTPTRQLPKSMDLLRWCDGDAAETSGSTIGRAKGSASCKSAELVDSTKISECPVLPLSCLGIWASRQRVRCFPYLSERSPSHTDFRIIRAFRRSAHIRGSLSSVPAKDPVQVKPRLLYFLFLGVVVLCSRVTELARPIGSWDPQTDPFCTTRTPRWSVHEARV